jgi:hypothetical protein
MARDQLRDQHSLDLVARLYANNSGERRPCLTSPLIEIVGLTPQNKSDLINAPVTQEPAPTRWLQDPSHANLREDQLAEAIEAETWDPSVKSLVPFPQILRMMETRRQPWKRGFLTYRTPGAPQRQTRWRREKASALLLAEVRLAWSFSIGSPSN